MGLNFGSLFGSLREIPLYLRAKQWGSNPPLSAMLGLHNRINGNVVLGSGKVARYNELV